MQLNEGGEFAVEAKNVIIATWPEVTPFPGGAFENDEEQIVSSTGTLFLQNVPGKMVVVGGGIIGLEMNSIWNYLGSEVTVVEFLNSIGGVGIDEEIWYVHLSFYFRVPVPQCVLATQKTNPKTIDQARSQVQAEHKGREEGWEGDRHFGGCEGRKATDGAWFSNSSFSSEVITGSS